MTNKLHEFQPFSRRGREKRPHRRHAPRHHPHRRICLAARRQLAGGVQGSRRLLDPAIRAHLEAENAYQAALMADTAELRKTAVRGDEGPHQGGRFLRADEGRAVRLRLVLQDGGEQPRYLPHAARRRRGGRSSSTATSKAEGKAYFRLGGVDHSTDHRRLLWAYDDKGSEFFTLRVRDLATGTDLADQVADTGGGGVWNADNDGFFYTRLDANHRPSKIFYHALGTTPRDDRLVYEETDPGFFMNVGGTPLERLDLHRHQRPRDLANTGCIPTSDPTAEPKLVAPRETGLRIRPRGRRRRLLHPDQCRRRQGFQDHDGAGRRPAPRKLDRARAARAGPADPVGARLQGFPGPAGAQGRPAAHRRARPRERRGAHRSPSTRRPIRSACRAPTNTTPTSCASPIRR